MSFVITLGIGTPGDIAHFILVGLSPNPGIVATAVPIFVHHARMQGAA